MCNTEKFYSTFIINLIFILQCFSRTTNHISLAKYPTLGASVPAFNYMMDHIENFQTSKYHQNVKNTAGVAMTKIKEYYWRTEGMVYIIATGK